MKIKSKTVFFLAVGIGLLELCGMLAWILNYNQWELRGHLTWVIPILLNVNFFLVVLAFILNFRFLKQILQGLKRTTIILVLVIAASSFFLSTLVAPRTHRVFYDEDIYMNVGQNIACIQRAGMCNEGGTLYGEYFCNRIEYNKDPNGWPFLLGIVYRVLGANHIGTFLLNNALWSLSAIAVFLIAYLLFENSKTGLYGAMLFALIPEGLRWANTAAAEPSAAFSAGLAILAFCIFIKNKCNWSFFLLTCLLPFSFHFRPESVLIVIPIGLGLLLFVPNEILRIRTWAFVLLFVALTLPQLVHLYSVSGEGWGAPEGIKFAWKFFFENLRVNGFFYLNNQKFHLLTTIFFVCGIALPAGQRVHLQQGHLKENRKFLFARQKALLVTWFMAFLGVFLFFYAGSYNYGSDVRFSLLSYMPMAILAGIGASSIDSWLQAKTKMPQIDQAIGAAILIWSLSFFPYIRAETQEAWSARFDHYAAERMAEQLPHHSLVLTHNPNMFLLWGKNAAQVSFAVQEPEYMKFAWARFAGGVFFHYNFWCNTDDPTQRSFCSEILKNFQTKEVVSYTEQNQKFILYRLEPLSNPK